MAPDESSNVRLVRSYLAALASGAVGEQLARFFTADALQVELPNALNPNGGSSDLATLLQRAEQGQRLLSQQTYDILRVVEQGPCVAVEARWSAVLAVPLGRLSAGQTMRAHFAIFFEFRDGRIASQRNYDCFEPW